MISEASKMHGERAHIVTQIIRSSGGQSADAIAEEIPRAIEQRAVAGFAHTRTNKSLIINSMGK